ncbi:hypothetical protein L580_3323 [Serratia fonticola AU-P3(3)]|nr:hypothetical protein L580_3323 [Serratia fonticola AU-P3(3)]
MEDNLKISYGTFTFYTEKIIETHLKCSKAEAKAILFHWRIISEIAGIDEDKLDMDFLRMKMLIDSAAK